MSLATTVSRLTGEYDARAMDFRPRRFRTAVAAERRGLAELVEQQPGVTVHDHVADALRELERTRRPGESATATANEGAHSARSNGREPDSCWVYYPWSRRLVHTLDESDFVELRTSRNRHKITTEEQRRLSQKRVGIVGLSVGHAVSMTLASERSVGTLRLADFDRLELSNLNRIRTGLHNIGVSKAVAAAREIAELDPFLDVQCRPEGVTPETIDAFLLDDGKLDLCIDECDDLAMKVLLRVRAREYGIPVIMDTSDRGTIDVERFDLEPDRPLFHGRVPGIEKMDIPSLSTQEKVPLILGILGADNISGRMVASLLEIGESLVTWPQLASAVTFGGGMTADVVRRILLGHFRGSGRYHVDLEQLISDPPVQVASKAVGDTDRGSARHAVERYLTRRGGDPRDGGLSAEESVRLVSAAIQAPSGGNAQPWRFAHHPTAGLLLFLDPTRPSSALDCGGAGAYVSLGACIENVVLTGHASGRPITAELFPDPGLDSLLPLVARFEHDEAATTVAEPETWSHLAGQIGRRHTQRTLGPRLPLKDENRRALSRAVSSIPGAALNLVEEPAHLDQLAQLAGRADRIRMLDPCQHASMMEEMRWTVSQAEETRDGLDVRTLELNDSDRAGLELCRSPEAMGLLARLDLGVGLTEFSRKRMAASSAVGLITMPEARPEAYVNGGRALQRMWLTASDVGVAVQPMAALPFLFAKALQGGDGLAEDHVDELLEMRRQYDRVLSLPPNRCDIMLVRFFYAEPAATRAMRRPVEDVLELLD